jgi:HSP20 family protein
MADQTVPSQKQRAGQTGTESTRGGNFFTPRVDIFETEKELVLQADVPGVRPEDVELRYEQGQLFLHGRVQPRPKQGTLLLQEYEDGDFYRVFEVHESVDAAKIEAECKNGVLTVHLPKSEAVRPRQIRVAGGETPGKGKGS